jgi:bloom syndrome protein
MEALPELHRVFVCQFVEEAKMEVDRIKNDRNLARLFFTEANLREMAISWTMTLPDMRQIPGINVDAVSKWGKYFIPMITRYSKNYDDAMNGCEDRDIDTNHQNVIDLCSDDEDEEFGLNDSEEEAIMQAEQLGSKYFQNPSAPTSVRRTESRGSSAAPRKNFRGGSFQYRGRGRRGGGSRRSGGSNSGQSTSGISKRKASGGASKRSGPRTASDSTTSKSFGLFKKFGNHGNSSGGGGGGGGGGIGMMPV